jgi:TPR repeat protein
LTKLAADRQAADQGYANAQSNIGWLYHNGWGVPQDYAQAMAWYQKAADQGFAAAQSNIGWLYENGKVGVKKHRGNSVVSKGRRSGDAIAQYAIGRLYELGLVVKNLVKAREWYEKSADRATATPRPLWTDSAASSAQRQPSSRAEAFCEQRRLNRVWGWFSSWTAGERRDIRLLRRHVAVGC